MKKIHLSVTNDLYTDQRVLKMARTLHQMGFEVHLCGVKRKDSKPFSPDFAQIKRIPLIFHKKIPVLRRIQPQAIHSPAVPKI